MNRLLSVISIVAASAIAAHAADAQELTIDGKGNVTIAGNLTVKGEIVVTKAITGSGDIETSGNMTAGGNLAASGDVTAKTISASETITAHGEVIAKSDVSVTGNISTEKFLVKKFGQDWYHLDYSAIRRWVALWVSGFPQSRVALGKPETVTQGLDLVRKIKGMSYSISPSDNGREARDYGLMPDGPENLPPGILVKDQSGHTWVDDRHAVVFLVEAVKEQQRLIESLQSEIKSIASRMNQTTPNPR
jgi:hypothetical protein